MHVLTKSLKRREKQTGLITATMEMHVNYGKRIDKSCTAINFFGKWMTVHRLSENEGTNKISVAKTKQKLPEYC